MRLRTQAHLKEVKNSNKFDINENIKFLYELHRALLLSLKEIGTLDEMQYRDAEKELQEQFLTLLKNKQPQNNLNEGDNNDK